MTGYLDLMDFIPNKVCCGKNCSSRKLNKNYDNVYLGLSYITIGSNSSKKEYSIVVPRKIKKTVRTFEVLGLLQAEMGKTQNGNLSFANNQPKIINYILNWFKKELELNERIWRWSIKLNINEPENKKYKREIETKVLDYWISKTKISSARAYPKKVTYIKNTNNKKLKFFDKGSLILEYKNNLFSQVIKSLVNKVTYEEILNCNKDLIQGYIKGILAGESTVELSKKDKKYRVHVSASKEMEKEIFHQCLKKLGINSIKYKGDKLIISKRENNIKLLNQRLMTLNPKKYAKFLNMMQQYPSIENETHYFKPKGQNVWNKIPQEKIDKIIELYKSGIIRTAQIVEKLEISKIKVNRILKENNLGIRKTKTSESKRKEIFQFAKENPKVSQREIAEKFRVHESVVLRSLKKYGFKKSKKDLLKTSAEKINQILKLYKENQKIKFNEVMERVGISSNALVRIRRIYGIDRLGHYYTVGNNPNGKNQYNKDFL